MREVAADLEEQPEVAIAVLEARGEDEVMVEGEKHQLQDLQDHPLPLMALVNQLT